MHLKKKKLMVLHSMLYRQKFQSLTGQRDKYCGKDVKRHGRLEHLTTSVTKRDI